MNKIALIIKKNILILVKSRMWLLVVVIAPLLIIFLTGIAFDNFNQYKINIGIYSGNYTPFTDSFIAKINTDQFRTIKTQSEAECIDDVKMGLSHTCVIFPSNLELGAKNKGISIFIDYSKLNLAWVIRDRLFSSVKEKSTEITRQLTENILSRLITTRDEISSDGVLVGLVKSNEINISNRTYEAFYLITSINTTVGLNSSDIDKLQSKINYVKSEFALAEMQNQIDLDFAQDIAKSGDFDDAARNGYLDEISKKRSRILEQQNYVENLFSPAYSASINNSLDTIRFRVDRLNRNANITDLLILSGKSNLYNVNQLNALNSKLTNRIEYSINGIKDNLNSIDELSAEDISAPVVADIKPLTAYNSYLNYIFPTLMAIAIMLAALLLSSIVIVMELNTPAYFRNFISPTTKAVFFFSFYITNLSLIGFQTLVMLLISVLFFFSQIIGNIFTTLAVCFVVATFFIILGMGIGYLFKTEQMAILAATFTASIFLFLSNILMPIEYMPELFMKVVQFNPFIISVSLLRKSILFQQPLLAINGEILYLVLFTIALLIIYSGVYLLGSRRFKQFF